MNLPKEIEFLRKNRIFLVRALDGEIAFIGGKITYSLVGEPEITDEVSFVENNPLRLYDIVESLSSPEVLHPLHFDTLISPVGKGGKYRMHVKWEGYENSAIKRTEDDGYKISRKELIEGLRMISERAEEIAVLLERERITVKKAYDRAYQILGPLLLEALFPGLVRGPFLRFPFRRITIKDFRDERNFSIRLTPFESKRLCRFLLLWTETFFSEPRA